MKKLFIFLIIFVAFSAKSQDYIKIPTPIAKKVALDLVRFDSTKIELKATKDILNLTEKKVIVKDSLISVLTLNKNNYLRQIEAEKAISKTWQEQYEQLQKYNKLANRRYNRTITLSSTLAFLLLGGLLYSNLK